MLNLAKEGMSIKATVMTSMESFIEHYSKYKTDKTAVFVERQQSLRAVYNYPDEDSKQLLWVPFMTDDWKSWTSQEDYELYPKILNKFLEDHIVDILPTPDVKDPGDGAFVRLAKGLDSKLCGPEELLMLARGQMQPNEPIVFLTQLKVFEHGETYKVPVRLKHQIVRDDINWKLSVYRSDRTQKLAFDDEVLKFRTNPDSVLYFGYA